MLRNIITVARFRKHPAFLYLSWLIIDYSGDTEETANRGTESGQEGSSQGQAGRKKGGAVQINYNGPGERHGTIFSLLEQRVEGHSFPCNTENISQ